MTIYDRIESLTPRLSRMAEVYSQGTFETADDLFQASVLHLVERQAADPAFAEQNDSYILDAARKRVLWPALRRAGIESKYTCGEPGPVDGEDGEDWFFDTIASPEISPETACEHLEQAAKLANVIRDRLSGREREVLSLVVKGVGTSQIADGFGITPAAVSIYKRRIANKVEFACDPIPT